MCGIAGFSGSNRRQLERMLASIVHRGPDGSGMEVNDYFSIGMRRLAIVDIDGGDQPLYNDDHTLALVFNGEIYNAAELRRRLEAKGHRFVTDHSDTEVILRGYEEWGHDVLNLLVGMFAFALWDAKRVELFLGRDRLGIKPLYYVERRNQVTFASEIKALFQDDTIARQYNASVLHHFLIYRVHDSGEDTFFAGVKRLLPGHFMIVGPEGVRKIERYWSPEVNPEFASERSDGEYAAEFGELFERVVRRHLISDAPVGVPLSGGLDSSGVMCTMAHLMREGADLHTNGRLHSFSALYPGRSIDESEYIHEVERATDSVPHYAYPELDQFWDEIMEWMWFQEEPTISSAPYAYYSVYRMASEHVKVMLSGNGGDELLAGYLPYVRAYVTSAVDQRHWLSAGRELIRGFDLYKGYLGETLRTKIPGASDSLSMRPLLAGGSDLRGLGYTPDRNLNQRLAQDVLAYSTPNLLRYEDKNAMAFSIESRVPFLDHELVEFIFKLPIDQKIKGGWNRAVYRNAMKGRIPEKIRLRRSKIGFTNPEGDWMRGRAKHIREIFASDACRDRGLYDIDALLASFDRWLAGAPGDFLIFWRILVTELWMQRFIDQPVAVAVRT